MIHALGLALLVLIVALTERVDTTAPTRGAGPTIVASSIGPADSSASVHGSSHTATTTTGKDASSGAYSSGHSSGRGSATTRTAVPASSGGSGGSSGDAAPKVRGAK